MNFIAVGRDVVEQERAFSRGKRYFGMSRSTRGGSLTSAQCVVDGSPRWASLPPIYGHTPGTSPMLALTLVVLDPLRLPMPLPSTFVHIQVRERRGRWGRDGVYVPLLGDSLCPLFIHPLNNASSFPNHDWGWGIILPFPMTRLYIVQPR